MATSTLESPGFLDGTALLRRGLGNNRLIRAVAGITAEDMYGWMNSPACQLINYRIRWGEVG